MWLNEVQGLQTDALYRYPINFTSLILTTGKGLSLKLGPAQNLLIFNRFALSCVNAAGKFRYHTATITVVILDLSQTKEQIANITSIRFPYVTLISTNSPDFWDMLTKRCLLTVNFVSLLELATIVGSKRALDGHKIEF